ncbi:hypothetical protein [Leifsonia sp. NPDC080035]|uniref:Uncharacterized protein n=1 Tax=Leifsonia sp. NPDC080035 TaxID=3143936 RepID=A0AAU7GIV0_9MICO
MTKITDDELEARVRAVAGLSPAQNAGVAAALTRVLDQLSDPDVRSGLAPKPVWWRRRPLFKLLRAGLPFVALSSEHHRRDDFVPMRVHTDVRARNQAARLSEVVVGEGGAEEDVGCTVNDE